MKWPWSRQRLDARLSGPETVDGRCLQQWAANALGQAEETGTEIRLGAHNVTRTYMVTVYPEGPAYLGRLNRLLKFHEGDPAKSQVHIRLAYHMQPSELPDNLSTRWLRNRQEGMVAQGEAQGTPDGATSKALMAYSQLWHSVQFQEDCIYELRLGISITSPDTDTLARMEQLLYSTVSTMGMAVTPLFKEQVEGLQFTHILGLRQGQLMDAWPGRYTHTLPLSTLYPFLHGGISEGSGVYIGHELDELGFKHAGFVDFTRGTGAMNWMVPGNAGEGKSTAIKGFNLGLLLEGFTIFQYDANGEYRPFTDFVGGVHVDMTAGSGHYFEPLIMPPPTGDSDYDNGRFSRTNQLFHCIIKGLAPDRTPAEEAVVNRVLMMTWKGAGVSRDDPNTWDRTASIHDWYRLLREMADLPDQPHAKSLHDKLEMFFEGTFPLFRIPKTPNWDGASFIRIAVSDSVNSNAADERIAGVKTLIVNHAVWDWIVRNKQRGLGYCMVNIDEGQRVLYDDDMSDHLFRIATDGRKMNAGLSVAANDLSVMWKTKGGRGLWENATLRALFYMTESGLQEAAENAKIPETVLEHVRSMGGTHEYVMTRDGRRWTRARMELPEIELTLAHTRGLKKEA